MKSIEALLPGNLSKDQIRIGLASICFVRALTIDVYYDTPPDKAGGVFTIILYCAL